MVKSVIVSLVVLAFVACESKPQTNAQKCASMGGTYNAAAKSCQFQTE